jgi:putative nucleotidyltransferase with HDIG domain
MNSTECCSTRTSSNNQEMTTTRLELIKQHVDSFPVLPVTVTRLMTVTSDPESSVQDVLEVILTDQSLCLTILKIANSVLFGRPKKVDSLKLAVAFLGFNEVQRIALTKALINSFSKIAQRHKSSIDKFWEHSFICGMAAKIIAQDLRIAPDIGFMGGLIHDLGKLIMLETFVDDYALEWMTGFSSEERLSEELHMFSFTHDKVGGQLLSKWLFPENFIAAVAYHHCPGEAAAEQGLACIIQVADALSHYCCNPQSLGGGDDILAAMDTSLADIRSQWQGAGLPLKNEAIAGWFDWLKNNYEQGCNLKEAFSA